MDRQPLELAAASLAGSDQLSGPSLGFWLPSSESSEMSSIRWGSISSPSAPTTRPTITSSFLSSLLDVQKAEPQAPCRPRPLPFQHTPRAPTSGSPAGILTWLAVVGGNPPALWGERGRAPDFPSGRALTSPTFLPPPHPGFWVAGVGGTARVCHRCFGVAEPREDV